MVEQIVIARKFRGPPDTANGGFVCGVVARLVRGEAEVSLRSPTPLERSLNILRDEREAVLLFDGETLLAEGQAAEVEIAVPDPIGVSEAEAASGSYIGFEEHPFPTCFVCGPERSAGDGLRVFPGPVPGRDLVATAWTPHPSVTDRQGFTPPEIVWAVLDCPTFFATAVEAGPSLSLLARMRGNLLGPVKGGEPHVVVGWPLGRDGRKRYAGSAIFTWDGELRAASHALWIEPK